MRLFYIENRKFLHAVGVVAFFWGIFILFFSEVLFSGRLLAPGDGYIYYFPAFQWDFDLWNQFVMAGFPQFADPQTMTWYLPKILFRNLSWNLFVICAYVLAGSFAYGYVYRITGRKLASLVGGLSYSMSGFLIAHLGHTSIIHTAAWLPLILWGLEELSLKYSSKWFVITSFAVAMNILAGHTQMMVYSLGVAGLYIVFCLIKKEAFAKRKFFVIATGSIAIGIILSAVQLVPTVELARLSLRSEMDFQTFVSYSLSFKESIMLLYPYIFGSADTEFYKYLYSGYCGLTELSGYMGWLPLMLAGFGVLIRKSQKRMYILFWFFISVLSFLLTLGSETPLANLMYHIPGFNMFRVPARHLMEFSFSVSVLAALGLDTILSNRLTKKSVILSGLGLLGTITLTLILIRNLIAYDQGSSIGITMTKYSIWENPAIWVPLLFGVLAWFSVIRISHAKEKLLSAVVLITILICDLASFGFFYEWKSASTVSPLVKSSNDVIDYSRIASLEGYVTNLTEIKPNISQLNGIISVNGYGPLMLTRFSEFTGMSTNGTISLTDFTEENRAFDLLSVKKFYKNSQDIISSHGMGWVSSNLNILLDTNKELIFDSLGSASKLGIVAHMGNSVGVANGVPVANIEIIYEDTSTEIMELVAGKDVSEWAYDRADVTAFIQHGRAEVFDSFIANDGKGGTFEGHNYIAKLDLDESKKIQTIKIKRVGPSAVALQINKISLSNNETGESWPINAFNNSSKWRYVGQDPYYKTDLYENLKVLPRAWFTNGVINLPSELVLQTIKTSKLPDGTLFDPAKTALIEGGLPSSWNNEESNASGSVDILKIDNDKIQYMTDSKKSAFLVLSENFYPGWKAYIDGVETEVYQTNYTLRGLIVPAGEHIVKLSFEPKSFTVGISITLLGLLVLVFIAVFGIRKKFFKTLKLLHDKLSKG